MYLYFSLLIRKPLYGCRLAVGAIRYLPSSDTKNPGHIKDYRVYVSDKPFGLTPP